MIVTGDPLTVTEKLCATDGAQKASAASEAHAAAYVDECLKDNNLDLRADRQMVPPPG